MTLWSSSKETKSGLDLEFLIWGLDKNLFLLNSSLDWIDTRKIEMVSKIIDKGDVGKVVAIDGNMLQVQLNDKTQAVDGNWKQLAAPGQNVLMFSDSDNVKIGDKVVIENEDLCLKKDKSSLKCDIILCSLWVVI